MKSNADLDSLVGAIYPCPVHGCSYVGKNKNSLSVHLSNKHYGKKRYCEYCEYWSRKSVHLKLHIRPHTGEKPFQCPVCAKSFVVKSKCNRHMGLKHPKVYGENMLLHCELCDYQAPNSTLLRAHMFKHRVVESDHYCKPCGLYFSVLSRLQTHCQSKKHQLKALASETESTNNDKIGLEQLVITVTAKTTANQRDQDVGNFNFNEKAHCGISLGDMETQSKYIRRKNAKQQRRIELGKLQKDTMFKCGWCDYHTGEVWEYIRHLRKISVSD